MKKLFLKWRVLYFAPIEVIDPKGALLINCGKTSIFFFDNTVSLSNNGETIIHLSLKESIRVAKKALKAVKEYEQYQELKKQLCKN